MPTHGEALRAAFDSRDLEQLVGLIGLDRSRWRGAAERQRRSLADRGCAPPASRRDDVPDVVRLRRARHPGGARSRRHRRDILWRLRPAHRRPHDRRPSRSPRPRGALAGRAGRRSAIAVLRPDGFALRSRARPDLGRGPAACSGRNEGGRRVTACRCPAGRSGASRTLRVGSRDHRRTRSGHPPSALSRASSIALERSVVMVCLR